MRNLLVHAYEKVDLKKIHASISPALSDFRAFAHAQARHMRLV